MILLAFVAALAGVACVSLGAMVADRREGEDWVPKSSAVFAAGCALLIASHAFAYLAAAWAHP